MNLAEFLAARLDEWEALAKAAGSHGRWGWPPNLDDRDIGNPGTPNNDAYFAECDFVEATSPAFVLAQVAAIRAVMGLCDEASDLDGRVDEEFRVGTRNTVAEPYIGDAMLRALAQPWADHPDYRAGA